MKKTILFKTLIDILYFMHLVGLLGVLFIMPLGITNITMADSNAKEWSLVHWIILLFSIITYLIFLRGLYFLRKMSRYMVSKKIFTISVIQNLKKAGNYFLYTGILHFLIGFFLWITKLLKGKINLIYDTNIMIPLFLSIIGLFFILQSNALHIAKNYKEENELTI